MKKGYWITLCHITDQENYGEYIKLAGPAIEGHGGKFCNSGFGLVTNSAIHALTSSVTCC